MNVPKMRRKDKTMPKDMAMALLTNSEYGIMSTVSEQNQCYGVPVNHVVYNDCIYFHGLTGNGFKAQNIRHNPNVSYTVVGKNMVIPFDFNTMFESVIVFGQASIVEDEDEKRASLIKLCEKFSGRHMDKMDAFFQADYHRTMMIKITIDHITGKWDKRNNNTTDTNNQ